MNHLAKIYYGYRATFTTSWNEAPTNYAPSLALLQGWESDGIRVMSLRLQAKGPQLVLEANGGLVPAFVTQRLKGRLQHALRREHPDAQGFDRDFFLRSLGQNDKQTVAAYVREQVNHSDLVDPLYRLSLNNLRFHGDANPHSQSAHQGRYEVVLHVILIVAGRYRMSVGEAKGISMSILSAGEEMGLGFYELSVMPDHVHLMCTSPYALSPSDVLEGLKEKSGERLRRPAFWNEGGYVGTVGPYRLAVALKRNADAGGWHAGRK